MKSPPPSTHEYRMKFFKLNPSLKGLVDEMMRANEGNRIPTSLFPKVEPRVLAINSKPLLMTNHEMKFKGLYESICVGLWRFPKFPMEFPSGNVGNSMRTFKIPHKCSHTTEWTIHPFILQSLIFHPLKFHSSKVFLGGLPVKFHKP